MRSRPLATIALALASSGAACRYVWTYDDYTNNGQPCTGAGECLSNNCALGACCPAECGPCSTCTDGGACVPVRHAVLDPRCSSGVCNDAGACK
jgi:hypothetical protein